MKRRTGIVLIGFAVLTVAGAWLGPRFVATLAAPSEPSAPPPKATTGSAGGGNALRVATVIVRATPFAETISSTGTLRAEESVDLQAEVNGKVVAVPFHEGAAVKQGDLLVKLNDADLRANLRRAASRRELALLRERRLSRLLEEGGANQQDYDAAANEVNVQAAEIELTEAQIAKTEIRAPFDGVVGLRFVSVGSYVTPASRIATLQGVANLKIDFSIPERYARYVAPGNRVEFTVAGGDQHYRGEVYAVEPRIDIATRTVLLRALCSNQDLALLPGAFANVKFTIAQRQDALLVPAIAVVPGLTEKTVYVVNQGKAERRTVQTGARTEAEVQVLEGLAPGDRVITSGIQQLRHGLPVAVRSE